MNLHTVLRNNQGIKRSSELRALGFGEHLLRMELRAGRLIRPQRGWIALPDADGQLLQAVRHGVILSCVTVAKRLGLWVLRDEPPHFATRTSTAKVDVGSHRLHWGAPVLRRPPHLVEDAIENALAYVAGCQPWEEALAIWESALKRGLVDKNRLCRLPYRGRARQLLETATPFSDSGLESYVLTRLRSLGLRVVAQAWVLGHRVDFLIEGWIVFQIDGGHHVGLVRDEDNRHDAELLLNGYFPIRASYRQVLSSWPDTQHSVMEAVSQGARVALAQARVSRPTGRISGYPSG